MRTVLTLMTFLLVAMQARAQGWSQTSGPEGADVVAMAALGSTLLVGAEPGMIYRHDNQGWTRLAELRVQQLYCVDSIFMATTLDGVYRSSDMGEHWDPIGPNGESFKLAMDGDILYVAVDSTIYKLSEAGIAWREIATAPVYFFNFFVHDSTILIARGGTSSGLYRSGDMGGHWEKVQTGLPADWAPQAFHAHGPALYLAIDVHGVFRSDDKGISWSPMNNGLPKTSNSYPAISSFASSGSQIWAGGRDGTFSCTDSTWKLQSVGVNRSLIGLSGALYYGSKEGVKMITDAGRTWRSLNPGLHAYRIDALATFGSAILAGAGGSIHRSMDGGANWSRINGISAIKFAGGGNSMYAIGRNFITAGIFRTTDGLDWGETGTGIPQEKRWLSALAAQGDTVFVGYYRTRLDPELEWLSGGVYRSTDGGATWSGANSGLPQGTQSEVPVFDLLAIGRIVLAQTVDGLYRSPDAGETWTRVTNLPFDALPGRLVKTGDRVFTAGSSRVYVSTDEGINWSLAGAGLPEDGYIHHISALRGTVYVSVSIEEDEARIFRLSEDRWVDITGRFPQDVQFLNFVDAGTMVMAGTASNSVWRGTLDPASSVPSEEITGDAIDLTTSPNPFRLQTAVSFTLKERADVRMTLISPLGQELAVMHDGIMEAGEHRVSLDGASLAAGAYQVRLEYGSSMQTMMVMKTR